MSQEVIDKNKYCDICGKKKAIDCHHLIGGVSERRICDRFEYMKIDVCRQCHDDIHNNNTANKLSKMLGQALFELNNSYAEYKELFKMNYLP